MAKTLAAAATTLLCLLALDAIWLGLVAQRWYQQGIGHLMAPQPNLGAAAAFYVVYTAGLMVFVVLPGARQPRRSAIALKAAFFGGVAYATYDLSNLATLRDWPLSLALVDIGWGCIISAAAALAGHAVISRQR